MTFIDNGSGGTPMIGYEDDVLEMNMNNIVMYGESEAKDCFYQNECDDRTHQGCKDRAGVMIGYAAKAGKDPLPKSKSLIPIHRIKTDASYGGNNNYNNLTFFNFKSNRTWCGAT